MKTRNLIFIALGLSALFGLLGAYAVASEPIAYIASMTYGILFLYLLIPSVFILFVSAVVAASLSKARYAAAFFLSCLLLPTFFLGGIAFARSVGWTRYETSGLNEIRPLDEEPNGNIIVIYQKDSTFEVQQELHNRVIFPYVKDVGPTDETGVESLMGLLDIDGRVAQKLFFRASATEEQKQRLKTGLDASPIVYRYFENLTEGEVRKKFETKQIPDPSPTKKR